MTPTIEQLLALRKVADAIIDTVKQAGSLGAPSGPMYAALMTQGCSLNQYQAIMGGLVRAGKLRQEGDLYFAN